MKKAIKFIDENIHFILFQCFINLILCLCYYSLIDLRSIMLYIWIFIPCVFNHLYYNSKTLKIMIGVKNLIINNISFLIITCVFILILYLMLTVIQASAFALFMVLNAYSYVIDSLIYSKCLKLQKIKYGERIAELESQISKIKNPIES